MQNYEQDDYYQHSFYKLTHDAYSLCLLGLFCSYFTILVAIVVAIYNFKRTKGTIFYTHLKYIIWGCAYYTIFLLGSIGVLVWTYRQHFFSQGFFWTPLITFLFFGLAPFIWWTIRFVRGINILKLGHHIQNPYTPWFGK